MAQADGTILIDTEINADGMKAGSKEVEAAVRRMASSMDNLSNKAKTSLEKQVNSFVKLNKEYAAQQKKVDDLKKKVAEYANQKIPTDEYKEIQAQIEQATIKMNRLIAAQERYINLGGSTKSNSFKKMEYDIEELANTIRYAEGELKDLEENGKAFTLGSGTKQAQADMEKLAAAERRLSDMNNRLGTSYSSIKRSVDDYNDQLSKTSNNQKKAASTGKRLSKSLNDTGKSAKSANFGIGKMLGTSILFSFVFQAISGVINAMKDGFTNLAQYSGETNNSISMLWSSLERLKNSLATAFAPILNVVAPILSKFIDMLSTAASYVSMFFSFLSGKSTYTRAIAVQKDYAGSLEDTAAGAQDAADSTNAAAEAAEDYLSPLDDINRMNEQSQGSGSGGGGGGGGAGGGSGSGPLFEEVPIDNKFASLMDTVLDKLKQIRDIFMDGFWEGLGDYKPLLKELKKDLSSIGKYLKDIFTDADVQKSAKKFVESFIKNVGKLSGSLARIGLTIAVNLVGGIESYLAENSDRIKKYLIRMFDAGTEIMDLVGDFSQAISEIFADVFGSQTAQDLTGDLIGIFAELSMLSQTLSLELARDIINFFVKPITGNKERIKKALMETLVPLESIAQSIETFTKKVADKLLGFYDDHIKPFIDSITNGVSKITGVILDGYNKYIAPILDAWAKKFDEVLNGPVGEAIDSVLNLLGKIIDVVKMLWEELLVPFISWIIKNIIPVIAPIIETLGNLVLDFFGVLADIISGIADALGGLIDFIVGIFTGDWDRAWNGVKNIFSGVWKAISSLLSGAWGAIKSIVSTGLRTVKSLISSGWNAVKTLTSTVWGGIKSVLSSAWSSMKNTASSSFESIRSKISSVWNGAKSTSVSTWSSVKSSLITIWNGMRDNAISIFGYVQTFVGNAWRSIGITASSIWSGMVGSIRGAVNGIIGAINGMIRGVTTGINYVIRALNRLRFTIPSWVPVFGGRSIGFNIGYVSAAQIPYLASGAVIPPNREFMAVLGDQTHGNNIEAPESLIRKIVREEAGGGLNGTITVPLYLDRRQIARAVVNGAKEIRQQTGKNPLEFA